MAVCSSEDSITRSIQHKKKKKKKKKQPRSVLAFSANVIRGQISIKNMCAEGSNTLRRGEDQYL